MMFSAEEWSNGTACADLAYLDCPKALSAGAGYLGRNAENAGEIVYPSGDTDRHTFKAALSSQLMIMSSFCVTLP